MPSSAVTLSLYVTHELERGLKVSTLSRKLNSMTFVHRENGCDPPTNREARAVMTGARRERRERPQGKTALTLPVLRRTMKSVCGIDTLQIRDRAVLLPGFSSGMRRSELSRLDLSDVSMLRQGVRRPNYAPKLKRRTAVWKARGNLPA